MAESAPKRSPVRDVRRDIRPLHWGADLLLASVPESGGACAKAMAWSAAGRAVADVWRHNAVAAARSGR
jgi:hypothetical protein